MLSRTKLSVYLVFSIGSAIFILEFLHKYIKRERIREMKHEWTVTPNWFSYQSKTTDRTVITYRMCIMSAGLFM